MRGEGASPNCRQRSLWLWMLMLTIPSVGAIAKSTSDPPAPPDDLAGPPFVSCRNWVVADATTGSFLGEYRGDTVVDVASTTKIMTAHLVLEMIRKDSNLLEQPVSFSERAARTEGSSCGLKAGEKLPLREMLYAMLLPSGNDAAVALGEHFGKRFAPGSRKGNDDSLSRFVAEMNRVAGEIGLSATRYANPHGLPEKGHVSTARDLARLTVIAWKSPLFREIVGTRQREIEIEGRDGKRRTLVWKNTNRLLGIEGYGGVKTGYTKAAGSCLVSTCRRGKDSLIVIVLGAPSAAAAVADSRNLFRWGWLDRGHRK